MCCYKAKPCTAPGVAGMLSLCCGREARENQHRSPPFTSPVAQAHGGSPANAYSQMQGQS